MDFAKLHKKIKGYIPHPWWDLQKYVKLVSSAFTYLLMLLFVVIYRLTANVVYDSLLEENDLKEWLKESLYFFRKQ